MAIGGLDLRVAAEDLQRWADAGEDQVGAAHTLALQALHPVADAHGNSRRTSAQSPTARVSGRGRQPSERWSPAGGSRAAVHAHFSSNRPRSCDHSRPDHSGEECFPAFGRLVREDHTSDSVIFEAILPP